MKIIIVLRVVEVLTRASHVDTCSHKTETCANWWIIADLSRSNPNKGKKD